MIEVKAVERETTISIPVDLFVELIERSEQLRIIERIADKDTLCFKDDVFMILGKEKSPAADQS